MKTWTIDPSHSEVQFKVKHLVISTVTGSFGRFSGQLETASDDFTPAKISFEAEVDSIDTNNADRDNHLKSADFFDAANHPKISFVSESFDKTGDSTYKLTGNLNMRGTTKKITLDVEHGGVMTDPYGNTKAGFELQGKVSRKEFGLSWNAVTEAGGVVVADEVKLLLNIQLARN
ncbi:MAG: YceI family protein [Bacteroidales bacterium]|jgi:polyisoprenoid-binding protein YceI|nr:YceI family protein [Bacteroidales bacterium]HOI32980.1 YceI family protein [Bacteroidales bacterium]